MPSPESAYRIAESVARESYGRLIAFLSARTRDPACAEDALSDALLSALTSWPHDGVPSNPQAWLLTVARNRLADASRRQLVQAQNARTLEIILRGLAEGTDLTSLPDQRLNLMLVCAHPAIDPTMHTPLMLQTVLGLDAVAIGNAFLVPPQTMGQRLVRAKKKIRQARIAFEIPEPSQLPQRVDAVMDAIYAAYGTSWDSAAGGEDGGRAVADEAIWLARVLRDQLPDEPEIRGLLALMLHCEARRQARRGEDGRYIPLADQDCGLWDGLMMQEAENEMTIAARLNRIGRFQLEAAIQSVHAERAYGGRTNWTAISVFYERLSLQYPTIGNLVGRAAAFGEVGVATAGIALLEAISDRADGYQPYWAVRAHLLSRLGQTNAAITAYDKAIVLTRDPAVRAFLYERRSQCEGR